MYSGVSRYTYVDKVEAWRLCVFKPGQRYNDFITRWRAAYNEMTVALGASLPEAYIYSNFLIAVGNNPASLDWVQSSKFDLDTDNMLERAIADFIVHEQRTKRYGTAASNLSGKVGKKQFQSHQQNSNDSGHEKKDKKGQQQK